MALLDVTAPLPDSRIPRRNPFAVAPIGDSRAKAVFADNAFTGRTLTAQSALNWCNTLLGKRLIIPATWGVDGDRTDQALLRLSSAISSGAGILYILCGVNDLGQGVEGTVSGGNVITMAEAGRNAGMTVVIEYEPGANTMATTDVLRRLGDHNSVIRDYADKAPGVYAHDPRPIVRNPAGATDRVANLTTYLFNDTHFNGRGNYYWGKSLANLFGALVPSRPSPLLASPYEADVANGRRQIALNPFFSTGAGGTLSNGATGTVPGSWIAGPGATGPTCAISVEASVPGNAVVTDATFTAADQYSRVSQAIDVTKLQAGDWVQAVADVEIVTPGNLATIQLMLSSTIDGVNRDSYDLYSPGSGGSYAYLGPNEPIRYPLATRPFQISPTAANIASMLMNVRGIAGGAGAAKWKVHQLALRRLDGGY